MGGKTELLKEKCGEEIAQFEKAEGSRVSLFHYHRGGCISFSLIFVAAFMESLEMDQLSNGQGYDRVNVRFD